MAEDDGAAAFVLLNKASARMSVDLGALIESIDGLDCGGVVDDLTYAHVYPCTCKIHTELLPTPPTKPEWMLSPSQQQQQQRGATGRPPQAGGTDAPASLQTPQPPTATGPAEATAAAVPAQARPSVAEAAEAAHELSEIAQAMRELEEAACPKKRTMTRFSFLGGASHCILLGWVGLLVYVYMCGSIHRSAIGWSIPILTYSLSSHHQHHQV